MLNQLKKCQKDQTSSIIKIPQKSAELIQENGEKIGWRTIQQVQHFLVEKKKKNENEKKKKKKKWKKRKKVAKNCEFLFRISKINSVKINYMQKGKIQITHT